MSSSTVYLKDYQPPVFAVEQIDLAFDLYDDHALVSNEMHLLRQTPGELMLNGEELELVSLQMNGRALDEADYQIQDGNLIINKPTDRVHLKIVTKIYPQKNTQLSGLYRSNHLFCTQCEAEGFRRITFYPDRPDVLSVFSTRISADKKKYPTLLSNGNLLDAGEEGEGRHWVLWQDPFKKPSYLFALVAGDLAYIQDRYLTSTGREVMLRIYVEPGNEDKCAHAMTSLKKAMRWDEEVYGREYDLDIFMIVAVSDFNMGAMENKGLNIFNAKYILARPDTATDADFADVEGVVGHEYFHNWTGNRVTCRDWFQLSLKEGLTVFRDQEFSRDMNSRDVNRILDVKALKMTQFPEDAGAMAHPVRPASYEEINNFYTATIYNKGAEVIRMQHTLLGAQGFRKGMDLYFERHDGQAVTIDDFVAAMEDANEVDLTQFKRWYSQAGTPEVRVHIKYQAGKLTLHLVQSCPATPDAQEKLPFHIPIRMALLDPENPGILLREEVLELKEDEQQFVIDRLPYQPVVSLLRDFSAPVKLNFQRSESELMALLRLETNGYAKWDAAQRLALGCLETMVTYADESPSEKLIEIYRSVLTDEHLDQSLIAELIMPPGFEEAAAHFKELDVLKLESARDRFRQDLGAGLFDEAESLYQILWQGEDHGLYGEAYGRRKLRNTCLWLMMKADEQRAIGYCQQQFSQAKTMSDQLAAFALLVNCSDESAHSEAIANFYQQWQKDDLVLDKWFSVQASSEKPGTLAKVKGLMSHPQFHLKNPNKVRSLIGAFVMANPRNFHAIDGSGYEFLKENLLVLDKINPQIAARLATPFTRWQNFDKPRQALMQSMLKELVCHTLSRDLNEMVTKSLA